MWLDSWGIRQGPMAGSCVYGNELPCSIKGGNIFDQLSILSNEWVGAAG